MEPGKEPLDFPAAARAPQRPAILGTRCGGSGDARDHLDPVGVAQVLIEPVAVVAAVADQPRGERVEEDAARVASTSVTSCGEALATWMARGRPWPSLIAMILLPLPRRVGPMAEPLFSPS